MSPGDTYVRTEASRHFDTSTALRLRRRYTNGMCLMFASAVARASGARIGVYRRGRCEGVAHAFVILDDSPPDRRRWIVADAVGRHTIDDVRAWFSATGGPLRWSPRRPLRRDPSDTEPDDAILTIAGCMPWLHDVVPPHWRVLDRVTQRERLVRLLDAVEDDHAPWHLTEGVVRDLEAKGGEDISPLVEPSVVGRTR